MTPAYCTILATNYLPRAVVLSDSLRRHESEFPLVVFLIDARPDTVLPEIPGVRWMWPAALELPERELLELAMFYDLVEFATALKPLVLQTLLREYEQVVYLDPDTYVTAPMLELGPALDESSGVVLTPHYLKPTPSSSRFSEGHLLHVGVYNLGFCAVNRDALDFLAWWWGHLRSECLHGPLDGLFTDQKWVDVGAVLFRATALQHPGYNVSVGNIHERPISVDADGYHVANTPHRLRLFHFHAFDPSRPGDLYSRASTSERRGDAGGEAIAALLEQYAAELIAKQREFSRGPSSYLYGSDTTGRPISRRMRHAYRSVVREDPRAAPSPFVVAEANEYERWRRGARVLAGRLVLSDLAKGVRCALPDEYDAVKRRFPRAARAFRSRYIEDSGMWT